MTRMRHPMVQVWNATTSVVPLSKKIIVAPGQSVVVPSAWMDKVVNARNVDLGNLKILSLGSKAPVNAKLKDAKSAVPPGPGYNDRVAVKGED